jgi:hypothetical protein
MIIPTVEECEGLLRQKSKEEIRDGYGKDYRADARPAAPLSNEA